MNSKNETRRTFLRYLASTPALGLASQSLAQSNNVTTENLIQNSSEAVNVFDFEPVAQRKLSNAHYTYLASGVDDGSTIRANRAGFEKLQLRVRRMVDVREINTEIELFGQRYACPIIVAPCGTQQAFHPEGELATAKASSSRNCLQILSTVPASNREALRRLRRDTNEECLACHIPGFENAIKRRPMFDGIDTSSLRTTRASNLDWDFMDQLRDFTDAKLLLKGIVTGEDAELALEHGADGLIVSNHGGRAENSGRGTIESLPEVVNAIQGRIPILVDSGFRRGVDIFKALAIGADAVCIGRPYLWGLSAYGQSGVEAVLDLLRNELIMMMQQAGTTNLASINRNHLV